MSDHTYPMMDSLQSTLESITAAIAAQELEDNGEDREDSTLAELVLSVDTEIVRDVMLGVGGPTRWLRFILSVDPGATFDNVNTFDADDLKRVEFHDSWAIPQSITLSDDEASSVVDALGFLVGIE